MKSKKSKGFRFIAFSCGYVESSMTSTLVYGTPFLGNKSFATRGEAITELALDLYAKFEDECPQVAARSCCQRFSTRPDPIEEYEYCPKCGRKLRPEGFDVYGFTEFVTELHNKDCDSYGEAEWFNGREPEFWPWSFSEFLTADKSEVIYIAENAEHVLLAALLDAKPDLKKRADQEIKEGDTWSSDWDEKFKKDKQPSYR